MLTIAHIAEKQIFLIVLFINVIIFFIAIFMHRTLWRNMTPFQAFISIVKSASPKENGVMLFLLMSSLILFFGVLIVGITLFITYKKRVRQ